MKTLVSVLLALSTAAAAMAEAPKANVAFVIEAQEFVAGLGASRQGVERALTQVVVEECRKETNFPFIQWVSGQPTAPNALVVALIQQKLRGGVETQLEFRATTREGTRRLPELQSTVYRWFDPKNVDIPDVVRPRLEDKIRKTFADAKFHADLLRTFVSQIPLADRVDFKGHRVMVPVPPSTLLADETRSELSVNFFGKTNPEPGMMTLQQPLAFAQAGGVLCRIKDFNFGDVPPLNGDWNDRIPQVIPAKVRDVRVTMSNYAYKWFPETTGGSLRHD
jgi:hypothetical protein